MIRDLFSEDLVKKSKKGEEKGKIFNYARSRIELKLMNPYLCFCNHKTINKFLFNLINQKNIWLLIYSS